MCEALCVRVETSRKSVVAPSSVDPRLSCVMTIAVTAVIAWTALAPLAASKEVGCRIVGMSPPGRLVQSVEPAIATLY